MGADAGGEDAGGEDAGGDEILDRAYGKMASIVGDKRIDLRVLGCSEGSKSVPLKDVFLATEPPTFSRATELLPPLASGLAITLAVSLAVYGIVRAIGWVIGGFTAG